MATAPATARERPPALIVESIGQPVALSGLARLLLRLHTQPNLTLVRNVPPGDLDAREAEAREGV